jgi:competence protein ComEC
MGWGADALRATVLKAGHHGSASSTSDEFLDAVKPSFAVFSCGRRNRYGHPAADVLARCRARGIEIHRTDLHGALVVETDGEKMWMTSYENSPEP